jgi:hypothetical protein
MRRTVPIAILAFLAFTVSGRVHEHGKASIEIVISESLVDIHLLVPSIDVVGVEHEPRLDADQTLIDEAIEQLERDGESLVEIRTRRAMTVQLDRVHVKPPESHVADHDDHEHSDYAIEIRYRVDDSRRIRDSSVE